MALAQSIADLPIGFATVYARSRGAALISASRDGDLLADAIHRFGYDVVRGSSSRSGASAILQLTEVLHQARCGDHSGWSAWPCLRTWARHYFFLRKIRCRSVADESGISRCWRLGSWDRFIVPATICQSARADQPAALCRNATNTPDEFESERLALQRHDGAG